MTPNTSIYLLSNIPLSADSPDTLYFESAAAQAAYFLSKSKYTFDAQQYQRQNQKSLRINRVADDLLNCNYLIFNNANYGNKNFYCFITQVNYINDNCAEIIYEIDTIQTFFFELAPDRAFIERQHSITDNIGDNILPEPVELGEYVYNSYKFYDALEETIVIANLAETDGNIYTNIYSGTQLKWYNHNTATGREQLKSMLKSYEQKPDNVIELYECPAAIVPMSVNNIVGFDTEAITLELSDDIITTQNLLDGYQPRNAKLYSYPYNYFFVDNGQDEKIDLRYEFFQNNHPKLQIVGSILSPVQVAAYPLNYKNADIDLSSSVVIKNYPKISWNYSIYKQWQSNLFYHTIENAAQNIFNPVGAVNAIGTGIISGFVGSYNPSNNRRLSKGSQNVGTLNSIMHRNSFNYGRASITYDYAKTADHFLDMYGYNKNCFEFINYSTRPHWNFIKTKDIVLKAGYDETIRKDFAERFNNGIRFWKNPLEVGNYFLDNRLSAS